MRVAIVVLEAMFRLHACMMLVDVFYENVARAKYEHAVRNA